MALFNEGKIRFQGNAMLATQFSRLFDLGS